MNPLAKVRSGAATATAKVRSGAGTGWGKTSGGVRSAWSKTGGGISSFGSGTRERATNVMDGARDGSANLWEKSGGARLMHSARSNPRVAIAWVAVALLVVAWIAWAIYIWSTNGSTAGVGVLISWPAAIAAIALVASPFLGAALLVRRFRPGGSPPMAGGADVPGSPAEAEKMTGGTYPG